ncbi:MAG: error-prone DNA polymerase [Deltaproteobacteria bacterium]|nr:error-prone DNA polymerase [Deltaproteobacteria bacterium]
MGPSYVELGATSAFSFLEGASLPEELAARAAELELTAVALTDWGGVYGLPRFHRAARAHGVRALCGAQLAVEGLGRLRLLCESRRGYRNLCRLLTRGHAAKAKGECRVTWAELAEHAGGLTCLVGHAALHLTPAALDTLKGIYGGEHLAVEIHRHLDRREEEIRRRRIDLADAAHLPLVATNDVRFARKDDRRLADLLTAIRHGVRLDHAGRLLLPSAEWCLKSAAEMLPLVRDRQDAWRHTLEVAERCAFTLDDLGYRFPDFPTPAGQSPAALLQELALAGARERYRPMTAKASAQLMRELRLIAKLELSGYFLIVWDLVRFARAQGILVQGRGSAANSAVCYALGITAVDPVGMDLLFERFLSEERGEWPDIDLDLPSGDARERVIQYVYRRYGTHGAAMTANVITFRDRSALREVGKALGFNPTQVDAVAKLGGRWSNAADPELLRERMRMTGLDPDDHRARLWRELTAAIMHLPRHLGQHSGGMVIAAGRLDEVTPIEPATMPGRTVIQWDKDDCAGLKIIKVDLLGLGMLAALQEAVPLIAKSEGVTVDYAHLPHDDAAVFDLLCRADTVGVFQVESRAQMATLPRLRPRRFYDLVIEIALIRPGPIVGQMVHPYLNRRAGREPVTYAHPSLTPILARTLGVPLFQEQLMRVAMTVAGFSGGEAEELRRAMGFKRSRERMAEIEVRLRAGMRARGIAEEAQAQIVRGITSFASYGFPESHSASFALIAYASAYLKVHHPAAFLCALLNAWPMGFYHPATLIKDAERHGVEVLPICVARSAWRCTLESRRSVRLGLCYTHGLKVQHADAIVAARAARPFASLVDFERRSKLADADLTTLAELGAFACFGLSRRQALWQASRLAERTVGLLGQIEADADDSPLAELGPFEVVGADFRNSQVTTGPHPMAFFRPRLDERGVCSAERLRQLAHGSRAATAGLVTVRQRPMTAKGFFFITLEDETGFANLIVAPPQFEAWRALLVTAPALWVEGVVQNQEQVVHLKLLSAGSLEEVMTDDAASVKVERYASHW